MASVDGGKPILENTGWSIGECVRVRGDDWTIVERTTYAGCVALRLSRGAPPNEVRTVLVPFDRPLRVRPRANVRLVRPRRWLHAVRRVAIAAHPFGGLTTAADTAIQILPYQLEPALAVLRHGATRLLIADAVGLGKTIQAGILLNELSARRESFRALVVTPAGLRDQWSRELASHFQLSARIADASWVAQSMRDLPRDINPWILPGLYVTSFEFLKQPEILRPLEELFWDAVVVDEAHGAAIGTARRSAVHAIAVRSRTVVLLTATPHPGDPAQFDSLCRIGELDARADRPMLFRRSRADVGLAADRRSALLSVTLSEAERWMHRLLEAYTDRLCREAHARGDALARLTAIVLRKRALSSASSLADSLGRRMTLLAGSPPAALQLPLPMEDGDAVDDGAPDGVLGAPGLADPACEQRWLAAVAGAARNAAARGESKLRFLLRLLARVREPAIVFTEYRDTLVRLQRAAAEAGHDVIALHGGLAARDRELAQRAFNERGGLLLATDAAAEGLNLHGRCRIVVHYELPWSPVRLEQRTGRVDRIGQLRTVHEILFVAGDTAERIVLAPLARRAARSRAAVPSPSRVLDLLTESRIASAVLDGRGIDPQLSTDDVIEPTNRRTNEQTNQRTERTNQRTNEQTILAAPPATLRMEAEAEADRLQRNRHWARLSARGTPDLKVWPARRAQRAARTPDDGCLISSASLRRSRRPPRLIAVYGLSLRADDGRIVHREIAAVRMLIDLARRPRSMPAARAALCDLIARYEPALHAAVETEAADRLHQIADAHSRCTDALRVRERMMGNTPSPAAQLIVQAGLFDRRAILAGAARRRTASALLEESEQRSDALLDALRIVPVIDLLAVLLTFQR